MAAVIQTERLTKSYGTNRGIIDAVARAAASWAVPWLVVDPVMVAKGGDRLLDPDAERAYVERLFPLASVLTPNLPEASALLGREVRTLDDMKAAARDLHRLGARAVVVKGGHLKGDATDLLWNGRDFTRFTAARVDSANTHGTGCTFSAAIAAGLARGQALGDAIRAAKAYVTLAIREGFKAGRGVGQLRHFVTDW